MATALVVLLWWLALFGWWVLLAGPGSGLELFAAACVALLAALLATAVNRRRRRSRTQARSLGGALLVPWAIARAVGRVFWAFALHLSGVRHISRTQPFDFPTGRAGTIPAGRRQGATEAASQNRHRNGTDTRAGARYRP